MSISFAIRPYRQEDLPAVLELFWETVHTVNADAYSADQLDAWAPADPDIQAWKTSLAAHRAYVAVDGTGELIGFGDIARGHIDRLYVQASCLGQGIGSALLRELERDAPRPLDVDASITAKPFFERHGYRAAAQQAVTRRSIELTNYRMVKRG